MAQMKSAALKLVLLSILPVLSVLAAGGGAAYVHHRYQFEDYLQKNDQVAQNEAKRLNAFVNYRLNELRSQLIYIYGEQSHLAKAMSEKGREDLLFTLRDHLAAYAVLIEGEKGWKLHKYYVRDSEKRNLEEVSKVFERTANSITEQGFGLLKLDAALFGMDWKQDKMDQSAFGVAFKEKDDHDSTVAFVGVFRPSYLFSFCQYFSDLVGQLSVNAFITDTQGTVLCHSEKHLQGDSFKKRDFFEKISAVTDKATVRYTDVFLNPVTAAINRIPKLNIFLVTEVAEVKSLSGLPLKNLGIVAGIILMITIVVAILLAKTTRKITKSVKLVAKKAIDQSEMDQLKEMVLDLQSEQAFVAGFQKMATELSEKKDLSEFLFEYLGQWERPLLWIQPDSNRKLQLIRQSDHWDEKKTDEINLGLPEGENFDALRTNKKFIKNLCRQLWFKDGDNPKVSDVWLQPVHFNKELMGILVLAKPKAKPEGETEKAPPVDLLPQVAQVYAWVQKARDVSR